MPEFSPYLFLLGNTCNVDLRPNNGKIRIGGPLDDARVGVTAEEGVFTDGLSGNGDVSNFYSDDDALAVGVNADGEAYIGRMFTVSFDPDGGSGVDEQTVLPGDKAAKPEKPVKDGCSFRGWTLDGAEYDFDTPVTGDIELRAVWEEETYEAVIILSVNVEFQGEIQLQFTLFFPESVLADESAYVTFEKAGTTTRKPVSEGTAKRDGLAFVIPVPAPEYADRITVKVYDGEDHLLRLESGGGTDYTENGFEYSVKQYAQNKAASGSTKQMRALARALDNYGTASQIYFQYGDYSDLSVDSAVTAVTPEDLAPYALTTSGTRPTGVTSASIVVEFDTDNTLRVTFKTDGSRALGGYTFLLDGTETVPKKSSKNGYLQVENIAAPNLDTAHTFTVTDGTDTYTVTASALSYGYTTVKNGDEARRNLGKALYLYNQAADAYFGG